jgi:uncharacterized membrane protein YkoI
MKTKPFTTTLAALLAAGLLLGSTAGGPAQQFSECLSNRQVQNAVADGQIMSLGRVLRRAGFENNWTPVSAEVCDAGGQLVYVVSLRQGNQVTDAVLDANTGDRL